MVIFNDHNCDICGSNEPIEIPFAKLYTANQPLHICSTCGFVYVVKRRTSEEIAKMWSEEIYGEIYSAVKNPAVISRQVFVAEFLSKHIELQGKDVCDIGAGEGLFLNYLRKEYFINPFAIEPSTVNCKRLESLGINAFDGTIEQYVSQKSKERKFDLITIMWTLENCLSCTDMLRMASSLLKPGGKILVATGSRILVPFKKPLFKYLSKNPLDSHSFRFSFNTLKSVLGLSGLKISYSNQYIDNDILSVLSEPLAENEKPEIVYDNPIAVMDFFERWHKESVYYIDHWK